MNHALSLPAIDKQGITVLNQLFYLGYQLFTEGVLPAQLIAYFSAPAVPTKTRLELRWDNLPIYLYLDSSLHELAASLLPPNVDISSLSEDITFALFEQFLLANYDQFLAIPLHLQKIDDNTAIPDNCYTLQWQPGHPILRGQLCIPSHVAPALIDQLTQAFTSILPASHFSASSTFIATLPFPVRMELGELTLSLAEIKKLEKHDLLLPETSYFTAGTMQLKLSASIGFAVKLENHTYTVVTSLESYKKHMDNNTNDFDEDFKRFLEDIPETSYDDDALLDEPPEDAENSSRSLQESEQISHLDTLEVRLTFDVGSLQFTLGELANIVPGYTFNLGRSTHKAVTIRANGTAIGKGELVDIEGTIGVSIVELYHKGQAS